MRKAAIGAGGDGQVRIIGGVLDNCQNCSDGNGGAATSAHFASVEAIGGRVRIEACT